MHILACMFLKWSCSTRVLIDYCGFCYEFCWLVLLWWIRWNGDQAGAPSYPVLTGRRDGGALNADAVDLPLPSLSFQESLAYFKSKGLDVLDMTTLLGNSSYNMNFIIFFFFFFFVRHKHLLYHFFKEHVIAMLLLKLRLFRYVRLCLRLYLITFVFVFSNESITIYILSINVFMSSFRVWRLHLYFEK